jgi:acyl transferase domain-containing protein
LWMSWGVEPAAMIGHSVGEYVAAELAGVFTLPEALALVAERGRLMQAMPRGSMLAVPLSEEELLPLLGPELALAAVNGPGQCVASGETAAVEALHARLGQRGIEARVLETSHAFHSPMMDGLLDAYRERVSRVALKAPSRRFVSNVTGDWITAEQARDPGYWTAQLRRCVRFGQGLARLFRDTEGAVLLEVGPGTVLTNLAQAVLGREAAAVSSLRGSKEGDRASALKALGRLWLGGVPVDWEKVHAGGQRRRVALPTYAFERQRYWVEAGAERVAPATLAKKTDVGGWFYVPGWRSSVSEGLGAPRSVDPGQPWLILGEADGLAAQLAERVRRSGGRVVLAVPGERFQRRTDGSFGLRLGAAEDYRLLVSELEAQRVSPRVVVHAASAVAVEGGGFESELERGFYSLLFLLQALGNRTAAESLRLLAVSCRQHDVTGGEPVVPERLALLGLAQVAAQEQPKLTARCVDVALSREGRLDEDTLERLLEEGLAGAAGAVVALRKARRWLQVFEPVRLPEPSRESLPLREGGTYLVTGGLGEIGLEVAEYLARTVRARLVLVGRTGLPLREHWGSLDGAAEPRARRVQKVRALEALGAQVLPLEADVADASRMRAVVAEAEMRLGPLHGVVHAAGTTRGRSFAALGQLGRAECEEQLRAKARGLYALEAALEGRRLDFRVLMSSLSAVLGGLSMGAYAAANLFMDGFSASREGWTSIDWDGWRLQESGRPEAAGSLAALAMTRSEGMEAFERALGARGLPRLVVSTGDLGLRLDQWVTRPAAEPAPEASAEAPASHSRPALGNEYVAPRDPTEQAIVEIWQELLGLQPLGVEDDFFELGGHSLLATQVMSRLRDAFGVEVPLRVLFERPTVAGLAAHVGAAPRRGREARIAELVERLKSMSPDERRALLEQEKLAREHA